MSPPALQYGPRPYGELELPDVIYGQAPSGKPPLFKGISPSNYLLGLDGEYVTIDGGASISAADDVSGGGATLTQASGPDQPTSVYDATVKRRAIRFQLPSFLEINGVNSGGAVAIVCAVLFRRNVSPAGRQAMADIRGGDASIYGYDASGIPAYYNGGFRQVTDWNPAGADGVKLESWYMLLEPGGAVFRVDGVSRPLISTLWTNRSHIAPQGCIGKHGNVLTLNNYLEDHDIFAMGWWADTVVANLPAYSAFQPTFAKYGVG